MGKRQHQKDKMYLTCTEWSTLYGGRAAVASLLEKKIGFRRVPFGHCSLSLIPFTHPLCSPEGHVFDLLSISPFLQKFGLNPVTGKKLSAKSLTKLTFHKDADGNYQCPVLMKTFNDNSHVVAVKTTGNVFSYEAVEQLNIKTKSFRDLLTDEPFLKSDIITLQDPNDLSKFNMSEFHHIKHNLRVLDDEEARKNPNFYLKCVSSETKEILAELKREYKPQEKKEAEGVKPTTLDKFNAAYYSTGAVAAGFTSTVMEPTTVHVAATLDDHVVRYARIKKKGYVRLLTNVGSLNLEIHCEMIQGGDPLGTGKGGDSVWGGPFKDEFKPNLSHTGRGVLSMANSGPDTNKSQFFITYRSCKHLDGKHTIFGRLVGGHDTLNAMEAVPADANDKPNARNFTRGPRTMEFLCAILYCNASVQHQRALLTRDPWTKSLYTFLTHTNPMQFKQEIQLLKATVFVDPFEEVDEALAKQREEERIESSKPQHLNPGTSGSGGKEYKSFKKGVGKYINPGGIEPSTTDAPTTKKKRKDATGTGKFGDFSSW